MTNTPKRPYLTSIIGEIAVSALVPRSAEPLRRSQRAGGTSAAVAFPASAEKASGVLHLQEDLVLDGAEG